MYELIIPRSVERDIKRLPNQLSRLLANEHFPSIQTNPHQSGFLYGKFRGLRKYALSYKGTEYRIIYKISEATKYEQELHKEEEPKSIEEIRQKAFNQVFDPFPKALKVMQESSFRPIRQPEARTTRYVMHPFLRHMLEKKLKIDN